MYRSAAIIILYLYPGYTKQTDTVKLGKSNKPTAASFIRPERPVDKPLSFLQAAHEKYVSELQALQENSEAAASKPIEISGKIVEEVGFDKIRKHLAALHELRVIILDGLRVHGVLAEQGVDRDQREKEIKRIGQTCPRVTELDLSRNLIRDWQDLADICSQLDALRALKLKYVKRTSPLCLLLYGVDVPDYRTVETVSMRFRKTTYRLQISPICF